MTNQVGGAKSTSGISLKSTSINGIKMYWVSGQKSLPTWLPPKKLRALKNKKGYRQRVDVLQDLWFETATTKIKPTADGEFLIASGIYPPQIKVYEYCQLSMKFERHLDSEVINFQVLSDDYSKIAFLCADRSICLHAKYGRHYSLRIPRMGRDITYDRWSCDLLCATSSPDLYRINLEQGRFLASLSTQSLAINVVSRSNVHGLVACGCNDGALECFDMRAKSSVGRINAVALEQESDSEVTALDFDDIGGYLVAVGSSAGKVFLYDLRSSRPVRVKDHMYGSAVVNIKWHQTLNTVKPKLISTDKHVVRIWDPETGEAMTSIEPNGGAINDVCIIPTTGLLMMALDCSQIPSYVLPALGPAPKWCTILDSLTEEMEEDSQQATIYDDFKFLTKEDLERLNLTNLIGTNLLRAYMHGFFIDYRLYMKAKSLADPFAYEAYIEKRKLEKLEAERASRITMKRKLPKVNRGLAARLIESERDDGIKKGKEDTTAKKVSKKNKGLGSELLNDERFRVMFENKDFEVDVSSAEYLALHPKAAKKQPSTIEEYFNPILEGDEPGISDSEISDDGLDHSNINIKNMCGKIPRLYEVKDERHAEAFLNNVSLAKEDVLPLEARVAALEQQQTTNISGNVKMGPGGSREISFVCKSSGSGKAHREPHERKKRGIKSLGLKSDNRTSQRRLMHGKRTVRG